MQRFICAFAFIAGSLLADPPGATLDQPVNVPVSMQTDTFATPRSLTLPPGFQISVWARVSGARFLAIAANGDVFVSQPSLGQITILRPDPNGGPPAQYVYASGLDSPQGLAFDTVDGVTWLYAGETEQIERYVYNNGDTLAPANRQVLITNLEGNDDHPFKDIAIGPDHTVYWGYGSSCNVCTADVEANPSLGAIYAMNPDGSNLHMFASGLRNPEGLAVVPGTNTLWAAVNNRDDIPYPFNDANGRQGQVIPEYVDNHPPEPFTSVTQGANYGWPFCNPTEDSPSGYYSMPFDNDQDTNADGHVDCSSMTRIVKGLQAHSAPLGLTFTQGTNIAAGYRNGALIGYHGSWDRTVPTGYKVVYFPWSSVSQSPGNQIDLVTGFYGWGRPVDSRVAPDGSLLITDDSAGAVYRMVWAPAAVSSASYYAVLAPSSLGSIYGSGLAAPNDGALTMTDSSGATHQAQLVYVSASQINFVVPPDIGAGPAQLSLNTGSTVLNLGTMQIASVAPSLFSMDESGSGPAAATTQTAGGVQYVSLYGTGIRGASSDSVQVYANGVPLPIQYAGPQPTYPGLDQINVSIPSSLAGAGVVEIQVVAGGVSSNVVTFNVQ
jgi:uncharacterized protein (TIGR03437 family)